MNDKTRDWAVLIVVAVVAMYGSWKYGGGNSKQNVDGVPHSVPSAKEEKQAKPAVKKRDPRNYHDSSR